jgi:type IV pilus assembly protein PilA
MKTTKKGFTLIELIVVIAIIGVLAAILVPTMLGYVRKSKISSANSAASSVYKGINSALTELDEEGIDVGGLWILDWDGSVWSATDDETIGDVVGSEGRFDKKVSNFFADITKIKYGEAALKDGGCVAFAGRTNKTYTGTYPGGVVTTDTYSGYSGDTTEAPSEALGDAICVACGAKPTGEEEQAGTLTIPEGGDPSGDFALLLAAVGSAGEVVKS